MSHSHGLMTANGLLDLDGSPVETPFAGRAVVAGATDSGKVALIVDRHEIWIGSGDTWERAVETSHVLNCLAWSQDGRLLVGTEKARLAWLEGTSLTFIESFDAIPERALWKTPWGGPPDTRSLAVDVDGAIYANIHVGWICGSRDGGATWKNLREGLEMDVHEVAAHPSAAGVVFAATARGFHISYDHGETFARRSEGMPYQYQRACACFPDRDVYLVSTSRGPHGQADALLFRSEDEGRTWTPVEGLPASISSNIDTFQIVPLEAGRAFVVVDNTHLYESDDWGTSWKHRLSTSGRIYGSVRLPFTTSRGADVAI